jgi:hypothetical protein
MKLLSAALLGLKVSGRYVLIQERRSILTMDVIALYVNLTDQLLPFWIANQLMDVIALYVNYPETNV